MTINIIISIAGSEKEGLLCLVFIYFFFLVNRCIHTCSRDAISTRNGEIDKTRKENACKCRSYIGSSMFD